MRNFSSRSFVVPVVLIAIAFAAACSDGDPKTGPEEKGQLAGNWIGFYPAYASMILKESNGVISGTAAVSAAGTANVTGTRNGSIVALQFTANRASPPATAPVATFQGTVSDSGITGVMARASGLSPTFTFTRIDTVAEGFGRFVVASGPFASTDSGLALFSGQGVGIQVTIRRADGYQVNVILPKRAITPGTYTMGLPDESEFWGSVTFERSGFIGVSGQVKIDLVRPKAIFGSFSFLGGSTQVTGSFSAFCVAEPCMPAN